MALEAVLDGRSRCLWVAAAARALGCGGIARVVEATGRSRNTVRSGLSELDKGATATLPVPARRTRRPGGGRKRMSEEDPDLVRVLEFHLESATHGDPGRSLR